MKKTRGDLVDFVKRHYQTPATFADFLIKEGWVELDQPREFWIMEGYPYSVFNNKDLCEKYARNYESEIHNQEKPEIIHVREVIDEPQEQHITRNGDY